MSQDFEELLESLNARKVRYLIGGAHALAFHARPRATKDLDLFVAPTRATPSASLTHCPTSSAVQRPATCRSKHCSTQISSSSWAWRPFASTFSLTLAR